ncbi:MAG TPA: diacylglycerol kinase family protein [Cytophagaceae bacterium]
MKGLVDIKKCLRSFRFAFQGLRWVVASENNARIHLLASMVVVTMGFLLRLKDSEWLWIISAIAAVWITETLNTAIEKLTDLVSPDFNPKAGVVKDIAAAAVLIAALYALIVGTIIFIPKI